MLDFSRVQNYYIACGYTDMRKQIDGLVAVVELQFKRKLDETSIFAVLRATGGSDQGTVLGWHRVCAVVQAACRETLPVAAQRGGAEAADKAGISVAHGGIVH